MSGGLEPDELTRLLTAAVDPIRPSPDAYQQIRAGIDRRRRWRIPTLAVGGMVMAALIGLAVVAIQPSPNNQVVEPAVPPLVSAPVTAPSRSAAAPSTGGSGGSGSTGGSGGVVVTPPRTSTPSAAPSTPASPSAVPTSPQATATTPSAGSPVLPVPAMKPAAAGDIDGDGHVDPVRLAANNKLEVQLSRGATVGRVELAEIVTPLRSAVVDIDADGFGELLVETASNNGTDNFALIRYVSLGVLVPLEPPAGLAIAAGVRGNSGVGFRCADKSLQISNGTSTDGSLFNVVTTTWTLTPDGLLQQDSQSGTVRLPTDATPFVAACGSLS